MATSDAPATVTELQTDLLQMLKEPTGVTALNTIALRYLNRANQAIHAERPGWPWQERRSVLLTHPGYSTGTVAIALATRTTVTGTSTLWNTAITGMGFNNSRVGGKVTFAGGTDVYVVSAVGSDTAWTLESRFVGNTALTTATYAYFEDEYALASDFGGLIDARYFTEDRTIPIIGTRDFYHRYARNSRTGAPKAATLLHLAPLSTAAVLPRVLLGPAPDQTYSLPYRYWTTNLATSAAGVGAAALSAATDEPIIPLRFRSALVLAAAALWVKERFKDAATASTYDADARTLLATARAGFNLTDDHPRMRPGVSSYWRHAKTPYTMSRGRQRYSTDTRFDTLGDISD